MTQLCSHPNYISPPSLAPSSQRGTDTSLFLHSSSLCPATHSFPHSSSPCSATHSSKISTDSLTMSNPSCLSHGSDAARPSQVPTAPSGNIAVDLFDVLISEPIHAATATTIGVPRPQDIECPEYANQFYVITCGLAVGIFFLW